MNNSWPTPNQKFEIYWKFIEPEIREMFFRIFKEGIIYAASAEEKRNEKKNNLSHK